MKKFKAETLQNKEHAKNVFVKCKEKRTCAERRCKALGLIKEL